MMTGDLSKHFCMMSRYNAWANGVLYDAVATLPAEEIVRNRRAFFGSIFGTLSHILVADRIWVGRMIGIPSIHTSLDECPYPDLDTLWEARTELDGRWIELIPNLPTSGVLTYKTLTGSPKETPWPLVLAHVFTHQAHHRGQVHTMINQTGMKPPQIDLLYFPDDQT